MGTFLPTDRNQIRRASALPIRQILYTSQAQRLMTEEDCQAILAESRRNNLRDGLTGMLIYVTNGTFLQVLEGADDALERTMERIARDPRHEHLGVILDIRVDDRSFGDWSMAYHAVDPEGLAERSGFLNADKEEDFQSLFENGPQIMFVMQKICFANDGR